MAFEAKGSGALVLRLIVGLVLLGCPRVGFARGIWSMIVTAVAYLSCARSCL
jgi:hypothetical protein